MCYNKNGKAEYSCKVGYELSGQTCIVKNNCIPEPCEDNAVCSTSLNNFTCTCSKGFEYNYVTRRCDDILECLKNPCPQNTICTETYGDYFCSCANGFQSNNNNTKNPICIDINECTSGLSDCDVNEICVNTNGGYNCNCKDGFILDDTTSTCVQSSTKQAPTTPTTSKPFPKDNTGLVLVIILPIIAVLILTSLAGLVCICWYRM